MRNRTFAAVAPLIIAACGSAGPPRTATTERRVETSEIAVVIPNGYADTTARTRAHFPEVAVSLEGPVSEGGPMIVFQKAFVDGGEIDEAGCAKRGRAMIDLTVQLGRPAKLRATAVVTWSGGKGCEYDSVSPDGVPNLLTEFHDGASTRDTPFEIWTMICQHGDVGAAIAVCRSAREGFVRK